MRCLILHENYGFLHGILSPSITGKGGTVIFLSKNTGALAEVKQYSSRGSAKLRSKLSACILSFSTLLYIRHLCMILVNGWQNPAKCTTAKLNLDKQPTKYSWPNDISFAVGVRHPESASFSRFLYGMQLERGSGKFKTL